MSLGLVFPGQGTQQTGMGERFWNLSIKAREVYNRASHLLGRDIAALCFRSTPEVLRDTRNAQVAIVVTNLAAFELLKEHGWIADILAGHSVGELAAIAAANCVDVDQVIVAAECRGELMSSVEIPGSMAAIAGLTSQKVDKLCERSPHGPVVSAAYNSPAITVVSGTGEGVEEVCRLAMAEGARVSPLDVSHAFHSPLMKEVRVPWIRHLAELDFRQPEVPIVLNVTGKIAGNAFDVRQDLIEQITQPVRWTAIMDCFRKRGVTQVVESGDSRVLTRLINNSNQPYTAESIKERRVIAEVMRPKDL